MRTTTQIRPEVLWQEGKEKIVVSGDTDYSSLKNMKSIMMELIGEFNNKNRIVFEGEYKDNF